MSTKKPLCLYSGELKELQPGDDLGVISGESASISGTAVIDFGEPPGTNMVTTTVSGQTGIKSTSAVLAFMMGEATDDHNAYEHMLAPIRLTCGNIVPGEGFDIVAVTDHRLTGTFNVRWSWA